MCPVCQKELAALEAKNADDIFIESANDMDDMFDKTLDAIIADESIDEVYEQAQVSVDVKDKPTHYLEHLRVLATVTLCK